MSDENYSTKGEMRKERAGVNGEATDTDYTPVHSLLKGRRCPFPVQSLLSAGAGVCVLSAKVLASTNTKHIFWMKIKENIKTLSG